MGRVPEWTDDGANTKPVDDVMLAKDAPVKVSTFN
jgi:hypothetical protein